MLSLLRTRRGRRLALALLLCTGVQARAADTLLEQAGFHLQSGVAGEAWPAQLQQDLTAMVADLPEELWPVRLWPDRRGLHLYWGPGPATAATGNTDPVLHLTGEDATDPVLRQVLRFLLDRYDRRYAVSAGKRWREISGWEPAYLGITTRANNQDPRAYAAHSGRRGPRQDFVTSAEHFILPPPSTMEESLRCRMPRKYQFLQEQFTGFVSPLDLAGTACKSMAEGMLDDLEFHDPVTGNPVDLGPITADTVLGFELLYATPGTGDAAEIAGHLMLRILLDNNPRARQLGMENPNDLVIAFMANTQAGARPAVAPTRDVEAKQCKSNWFGPVDDASAFDALGSVVQLLKGLSGGFLTLMERQTLAQALKTYTIEEDRNLLRYRLHLDARQKNDLLEHLFRAKKNYNAKYYFFDQNCASVLVKVIGQGIGNRRLADFDPVVSPPNSLVGLFVREGLATPVYPSFYSYRRNGQLAQLMLRQKLRAARADFPLAQWPALDALTDARGSRRLQAVAQLQHIAAAQPAAADTLNELAVLLQETELVYAQLNLDCEQYTGNVTQRLRDLQQQVAPRLPALVRVSVEDQVAELGAEREQAAFAQGVAHTNLLSFGLASALWQSAGASRAGFTLDGALERQDMGSFSKIAMQRAGSVVLGGTSLSFGEGEKGGGLQQWRFTGLEVRKFKEVLGTVPGIFSQRGAPGLGLSLLDFAGDEDLHIRHGTLAGAELLFNLAASPGFNDYAFVSLGADIHRHFERGHDDAGIMLPIGLDTLWTPDAERRWQWRNHLEYRLPTNEKQDAEFSLRSDLAWRLSGRDDQQTLVKLGASQEQVLAGHAGEQERMRRGISLGVEINRW